MKKLLFVAAFTLALNFLALVGGAVYLNRTGHLDKARIMAIKALLYPPPAPMTQPAAPSDATTQPSLQLDDLLRRAAGRSADEQVNFLQHTFDERMAEMDRRQREVADQQRQVDFGRQKLAQDRTALDQEKKRLDDRDQQAGKLAQDQGFQDSLQLYTAMPPKQVKTIFLTLKDETIRQYLETMPPKTASKIIKEFKTPEETTRIQMVLEQMRKAGTDPAAAPQSAGTDKSPAVER